MHPRSWFFPLGLLLLVLGLVWIRQSRLSPDSSAADPIRAPQKGFTAPGFTLPDQNGDLVSLDDFRGRAVLVNIWASWCAPCRAEMPAMQRAFEALESEGFVVLAVNATSQDSEAAALEFAEELGLTFPILLDHDGLVTGLYQNRALPSSFFIDPQGLIQDVIIGGPMAEALLITRVERLIPGGR